MAEAADLAATAATAAKGSPSITRATSSDSPAPWNAAVPTARISITGTGNAPPFLFHLFCNLFNEKSKKILKLFSNIFLKI